MTQLDSKFTKVSRADIFLPAKPVYFHHTKAKRAKKDQKVQRLVGATDQNKLRWLQSMYKQGKAQELAGDDQAKIEALLDGERFLAGDDQELDRQAEEIIKWSEELDFQKYADEWFFKSTIFINIDPN